MTSGEREREWERGGERDGERESADQNHFSYQQFGWPSNTVCLTATQF